MPPKKGAFFVHNKLQEPPPPSNLQSVPCFINFKTNLKVIMNSPAEVIAKVDTLTGKSTKCLCKFQSVTCFKIPLLTAEHILFTDVRQIPSVI